MAYYSLSTFFRESATLLLKYTCLNICRYLDVTGNLEQHVTTIAEFVEVIAQHVRPSKVCSLSPLQRVSNVSSIAT